MNACAMNVNEWVAVFCKPRQERGAEANLSRQGFHVYLPQVRVRQHARGRWMESLQALFPRYLFVRIQRESTNTSPIRSTLGVVGMVKFGGEPAVVPQALMDEIAQRAEAYAAAGAIGASSMRVGDTVKVVAGPLVGLEGVFAQPDGERRAMVLMEILGKTNRVRLDRDLIARVA